MFRNKVLWLLAPILCLLMMSCMNFRQPGTKVDYYTLEYEPPAPEGLSPVKGILRVLRFTVAPPYNTSQVVYRDQAFTRKTYHYHKWRANPGELVSYFLARDLRHTGLFRAVLQDDSKIPSTHLLEGTVDEFYERDTAQAWMATLTVTITLMAEHEQDISRRILFQKTYRTTEPSKHKNPRFLAEAMSRAMAKISGEMIRDITNQLP